MHLGSNTLLHSGLALNAEKKPEYKNKLLIFNSRFQDKLNTAVMDVKALCLCDSIFDDALPVVENEDIIINLHNYLCLLLGTSCDIIQWSSSNNTALLQQLQSQ